MIRILFTLLFLIGTVLPSFAEAATSFSEKAAKLAGITAVRMAGSMERLRIVLDANKEVDYSTMVLSNPSRVVVDLHGAWLSPNVARETVIESRFASKVRVAQFNENTVRVVVETTMGKGHYDVFSIEGGAIPYRVVLDFGKVGRTKDDSHGGTITDDRVGSDEPATEKKEGQQPEPSGEDKKEEKPSGKDNAYGKEKPGEEKKPDDNVEELSGEVEFSPGVKGKKIVIDPGHGGEDSGAIGPSGVTEKSITLQIAKEVEKMLKEAGAKVIMTRTTDTEVSSKHRQATDVDELQARCDVANKAKADIFISIHMDSFTSREASGTTGYYYTKGSAASKRLAAEIQSNLVAQLKTTSRGIKTCNFYVVKHTKMPATLIEVAFVSNPKEEKLLTSRKGVQKAAVGIVKGISDFFGE
ncbi:MAG: N-acetylmuramoyl-L-alanine amidase [Selenomonadaceae bacterium]|nr:N-acetylmuramoyl-L-alanine amidase [Selenomonadaceae bacterium]